MESIKELRNITQGSKRKQASIIELYLIRSLSIYFTKLFLLINVSANTVTAINIFVAFLSGLFIGLYTPLYLLIGSVLLYMILILDCSDGEIARYHRGDTLGIESVRGKYYDIIMHFVSMISLFGFLSIRLFFIYNYKCFLYLGLFSIMGSVVDKLVIFAVYMSVSVKVLKAYNTPELQNWKYNDKKSVPGYIYRSPIEPVSFKNENNILKKSIYIIKNIMFSEHIILFTAIFIGIIESIKLFVLDKVGFSLFIPFIIFYGIFYIFSIISKIIKIKNQKSIMKIYDIFKSYSK